MKRTLSVFAVAALAMVLVPASMASAQDGTSEVYIVHGIDLGDGPGGFPVTVCANGDQLLTDFTTSEVVGPVTLPEGSYDIEVYAGADVECGSEEPAIAQTIPVPAGANVSVIAYIEVGEGPALTALVNDVACLDAGDARVTARHLADAPPVDVWANGAPLFEDLANGEQASADVPAGTYEVAVELVGGGVVIAPTSLPLAASANTIVSVIGGGNAEPSVILQEIAVPTCEVPVDPPAEPAAEAVGARPAFTG